MHYTLPSVVENVWRQSLGMIRKKPSVVPNPIPGTSFFTSYSHCVNSLNLQWTPAKWTRFDNVTSENQCKKENTDRGKGEYEWFKWKKVGGDYDNADPLPAHDTADFRANTSRARFKIGPSHIEPEHVLPKTCIESTQFLADAASGKTAAQAVAANKAYYEAGIFKAVLGSCLVINSPAATQKANFTLLDGYKGYPLCFVGLYNAMNRGSVNIFGGVKTYALVLSPLHLAGADPLLVKGKTSATVLGGSYCK